MHKDQRRRSGEPYLNHPLSVSYLLADLQFDDVCVAVGLLHDVLEDTLTTREVLESEFGTDVADLVEAVTKIGRHAYVRRDQAQAETFRKMILASARDIRVILVKLADRLHNMQTLQHMKPESRRRISQETLEIYAPIAHRLGMAKVKGDLEDLAFFFLYPLQFRELYKKLEEKLSLVREGVEELREQFSNRLERAGIQAEITFRVKRYYSIWTKLRRQGIDISQLYDYLAFRIITSDVKDTYAALGIVHQHWRPIPGRFKDYIAMPKPNLYQSLHTTVMDSRGRPFEVQIRTREMDLVAEEGIAAHWRYKEGKKSDKVPGDLDILWLRQLLEWQKEVQDPRTFLTTLKIDLYPDEVYIFTPKGEVLCFPRGATPLDMAYRVHTDLGHTCAGARINGRLVPLRTPLQNGDMIEILTSPTSSPSRDWLSYVATSRAKSKIRHWLNAVQKKRAVEIGRPLLEKELRKYKISPKKVLESRRLTELLEQEGVANLEDLYSRIGFGKLSAKNLVPRLLTDDQLAEPATPPGALRRAVSKILPFGSSASPVLVKGEGDLLAFLAKCCNPVPGEDIVGYVTRGRGVSVHAAECANVRNLLYNEDRQIEVEWASKDQSRYRVTLKVEATDNPGVLAKLTEAIAKLDSNITHLEAETKDTGQGLIEIGVQVRDRRHLEKMIRGLRAVSGVSKVERQMGGGRSGRRVLP
jgi:GTP pyrophosphokinase